MQRRHFLQAGLAGAALPAASRLATAEPQELADQGQEAFKLKYAPHFGMFSRAAGDDSVAQLEWAADHGFTAWEDNQMANRDVAEQQRLAAAMDRLGITMGVFVANFGTAFGKQSFSTASKEHVENFEGDLRKAVEVAKRVHAKCMTIVLGDLEPRLAPEFQHSNAIEMLKRGAAIFEPEDLVMVMEPLNFRDHPGMLLSRIPQAHMLCKAVDSPAVKVLFDIYHQQITEGNLIPNIDAAWDEIAYFQVGDNPGRNEPTTGEINYLNVFRHIANKGFGGVVGMEHGNSQGGEAGDLAVLEAYRASDRFELGQ